jgi:hypothetical protein
MEDKWERICDAIRAGIDEELKRANDYRDDWCPINMSCCIFEQLIAIGAIERPPPRHFLEPGQPKPGPKKVELKLV